MHSFPKTLIVLLLVHIVCIYMPLVGVFKRLSGLETLNILSTTLVQYNFTTLSYHTTRRDAIR